jgi:hypothetical protein
LTGQGAYSASLLLQGVKYSFSGQCGAGGAASNYIARALNPITLQWTADLSGSNGITGLLTTPNWNATLTAHLNPYSKTNPAPQEGQYTLHFPTPRPKSIFPGGDGFGAATVTSNGIVQFTGTLGDETVVSQTVGVSRAGRWPFYASLYNGTGVVLGWLTFTNLPGADLTGEVNWIKTSHFASTPYSAGFYFAGDAEGSAFVFKKGSPVLDLAPGYLSFSDDDLSAPFTNQVTLNSNNTIANLSPNALSLTISTSTGIFHGSVVVPGSHVPLPFSGAVYQKQNAAYGLFLNKTETGRLKLSPNP